MLLGAKGGSATDFGTSARDRAALLSDNRSRAAFLDDAVVAGFEIKPRGLRFRP